MKGEWSFKRLFERFANERFKVGTDKKGDNLKVPMKKYIEYVLYNRDDSPLYLF